MARDFAYNEAEKKIEQALKWQAKTLDLSAPEWEVPKRPRLTELPDSIGALSQLESLNLSYNKLIELPESLTNLKRLHTLNISHNRLNSLSNSFGQIKSLCIINLSNNSFSTVSEPLFKITKLKSLDISCNQLEVLSESLEKLKQLEFLDISSNKLTKLPKAIVKLVNLQSLYISFNHFSLLPEWIGELPLLQELYLTENQLTKLPEKIGRLSHLHLLDVAENRLSTLPNSIGKLLKLESLNLTNNQIFSLPTSIGALTQLRQLYTASNKLTELPATFSNLNDLQELNLNENPLNPELAAAYKQGIEALYSYLRIIAEAQITLQEAKLILIGEGEVGKTCLMDALLDKAWREHPSTHGIEIQQVKVTDTKTKNEITLNGWDFGGQRVYRPTHQLFFSAPAVYLVVWKPREGPQQGFVKEWIQLVKRREPSAKILVVATHGGPQQRQPDIDRQELWDLFGKDSVVDFFWVDSMPDKYGNRKGIKELKLAIARVAAELPEVGRSVPKSFQDVREALKNRKAPYLPLDEVLAICRAHNMDDEIARLFITISHRLGHLTHYQNDPALRDIVILRPDWLATAMSYILDDEVTRTAHGLVKFSHLSKLWDDPARPADTRYTDKLHPIFLRLMERFDLSYRVAGLSKNDDADPISLIAQLVPDTTPKEADFNKAWLPETVQGDIQQTQICRIVDAQNGQSANAEGLFFQLIVRLHKFSIGRLDYNDSLHWQRGLVVDGDYNGRALLRHIGNDVHITVRAPYPERFLGMLTEEVKYLVESFWEGLRCDITVPCLNPNHCAGLFEVEKLIENKRRGRPEQPCQTCNEWQNIDQLLLNAPDARPIPTIEVLSNQAILGELGKLRKVLVKQNHTVMGRFDNLDTNQRKLLSKADASFNVLMRTFTDEAKEGPRLFSMRPIDPKWLMKPKKLVSQKFRILLWCEHSQLPVFVFNKESDSRGIYEMDLPYEWLIKAAPYLKAVTTTLSLILPVASSATKLWMSENTYEDMKNQLAFGKDVFDSLLKGTDKVADWEDKSNVPNLPHGVMQRAEGALLRELHSFLKAKDPGFGGLVRVMNKRQEFLWVHEKFAGEY